MTTDKTVSSALRDELIKRIQAERSGAQVESPAKTTAPEDMFKPQESVNTENKKPYSEIVGEPHPSGIDYHFTVYKDEDWPELVRPLIPDVDPDHVPDHDYMLTILMAIEYGKVAFAYGPPGSGKSVTPAQVCALIRYPFKFIAGMGGTEPSDYVGSPWVEDGSMSWKDGEASFCVRNGVFMLYDEPFKASAQTNMCFQSLMDTRKTLKLYGHPDPIEGNLKAHPKFRMMMADNVRGFGDDMDKYSAEIQDQSTLNRCAYKVHVDYVKPDVETKLLKKKFPTLTDTLARKVVSLAGMIREGWNKGDITAPYSIRDTQELVEAALVHRDVGRAFTQTYFGAIKDPEESNAVRDIFRTVFGSAVQL